MMHFLAVYGLSLLGKTWQHIYISGISLGLGIIVAVPVGIALTRQTYGKHRGFHC